MIYGTNVHFYSRLYVNKLNPDTYKVNMFCNLPQKLNFVFSRSINLALKKAQEYNHVLALTCIIIASMGHNRYKFT